MINNDFYPDVYYGNCCGNAKNCLYSHKGIAKSADEFKAFLKYDHTFIQFKGDYRSKDNFIKANTVVFDCDNEFSDVSSEWVKPESIKDIFKNVKCIIYTSRNHMRQKGNKSPRPRFHVIFPVEQIVTASSFCELTAKVCQLYPFFDDNAIDAGRFFFGNPDTEVTVITGEKTLDAYFKDFESELNSDEKIPEGKRNSTMSAYAGNIIKRYGDSDEAYAKFMSKAAQCKPLLEDAELQSIWKSAQGFYKRISSQPGYVPPDEYNNPSETQWDIPIPFTQKELPLFPIDALPETIRKYVVAVSESTQTPVDMLSGLYTKNVNIDVMLKGHSGDSIRVDRIGRNSESIMNPALTVLLTVQPSVLSGLMQNGTFRGRGLTARFLYCMPKSIVGNRKYRTEPIPSTVSDDYYALINELLDEEEKDEPELITISAQADRLLESYSNEVESKLKTDYVDFADWAGKLVGAVLRIAGLLCRASALRLGVFGDDYAPLVVDEATMNNAIKIGRYFTEHTSAAFSLMGADMLVKQSEYVLDTICKNGLVKFSRRDIMRLCRTFKTADSIQLVLNHLVDYGYLAVKSNDATTIKGRPTGQVYIVNQYLYRKAS